MDSSLATVFWSDAGIAGLVVVLIIFKVLVPGWYAKGLEKQNELLSATAERAVNELAMRNQLILELRSIAVQRAADAGGNTHAAAPVAPPGP